jgi:hypothetical protein
MGVDLHREEFRTVIHRRAHFMKPPATMKLSGPHPYQPGRLPDVSYQVKIQSPEIFHVLNARVKTHPKEIHHTAGPFDLSTAEDQRFLLGVLFDLQKQNRIETRDWILAADPTPKYHTHPAAKPVALFTKPVV